MAPDVLIVEDDHDIRSVMVDLLQDEGYAVLQAQHGREALELLAREPLPKLILLDLMMPVMNGWQFMEAKSKDPRLAPIPVVILSADDDLARKTAQLGVQGFYRKPIDIETLLDRLQSYCPRASNR